MACCACTGKKLLGHCLGIVLLSAIVATAQDNKPAAAADVAPPFAVLDRLDEEKQQDEQRQWQLQREQRFTDALHLVRLAQRHRREYDEQIRTLLRADQMVGQLLEEKATPEVTQLRKQIQNMIGQVPPPARFSPFQGIELRLAGDPDNPFFVTAAPIANALLLRFLDDHPQMMPERRQQLAALETSDPDALATAVDELSLPTAKLLSQWLQRRTQQPLTIPTIEQLRQLEVAPAGMAFWSSSKFEPDQPDRAREMVRFGVGMVQIWDPQRLLGDDSSVAELPGAAYKALGLLLVAPVELGQHHRLQRLVAELK